MQIAGIRTRIVKHAGKAVSAGMFPARIPAADAADTGTMGGNTYRVFTLSPFWNGWIPGRMNVEVPGCLMRRIDAPGF